MKPTDILLALATVAIWGFNFVVIKIGLQDLPPILFTTLRFLFAALPLVFFVKRPAVPFKLLAGYAMFQFALQFTLLFSGMKLGLPPGLASLVVQLQAFFTIGLAVLLLHERPLATQMIGALIAFSGMGLVALHLEAQATAIGFVMVVAAGACWAAANIFTKKIGTATADTGKINPMALVIWGSLLATPPLALASLVIEGPSAWAQAAAQFGWMTAGAVFFQSYPNTILGFGIWSLLMRKYPTATIAPFTLLVPVTGMLSAALVLGEPLQWWKIAAGLLVLAGLALNQFGARLPLSATRLR
ncbi:MAG TPA: EamA family transporter [Paucimonas sp.]|nr:EamA family transporter [Paucimonas sp.]